MSSVPYHVEQKRYTGPTKNGMTGLRSIPEQRKHSGGKSRGTRRKESRADPSSPAERRLQAKKSPASYPERGFAQNGPPQAAFRPLGRLPVWAVKQGLKPPKAHSRETPAQQHEICERQRQQGQETTSRRPRTRGAGLPE